MESATSDEQIVQQALTGDVDAFGEIVRRWERRIFALAFGMLGREEDARDATQETFLAAFVTCADSVATQKFHRGCTGLRSTSALRGSAGESSQRDRARPGSGNKCRGVRAASTRFPCQRC